MDSGLCTDYLVLRSNSNLLHNSQWITFPTHSCLILYSIFVKLLHSLTVSFLSPHNLHLVLYYFRFNMISPFWIICAVINKDSVFLSGDFLFLAMSRPSGEQSRHFVAWNIHTVVFLSFLSSRFCYFSIAILSLAVVFNLSLLSWLYFSNP